MYCLLTNNNASKKFLALKLNDLSGGQIVSKEGLISKPAEVAIELILHLLRARLRFTIKQPAHTHDLQQARSLSQEAQESKERE